MESRFRSSFPKKSGEISLRYKIAVDNWRMETWRHTSGMWSMAAIMVENWFESGEDRLDDGL